MSGGALIVSSGGVLELLGADTLSGVTVQAGHCVLKLPSTASATIYLREWRADRAPPPGPPRGQRAPAPRRRRPRRAARARRRPARGGDPRREPPPGRRCCATPSGSAPRWPPAWLSRRIRHPAGTDRHHRGEIPRPCHHLRARLQRIVGYPRRVHRRRAAGHGQRRRRHRGRAQRWPSRPSRSCRSTTAGCDLPDAARGAARGFAGRQLAVDRIVDADRRGDRGRGPLPWPHSDAAACPGDRSDAGADGLPRRRPGRPAAAARAPRRAR